MAFTKQHFIVVFVIGGLLIVAGILMIQQRKKVAAIEASLPDSEKFELQVKKIFGSPESFDDEGVSGVTFGGETSVITYKFHPLGLFNFKTELGVELAEKIRKLYEKENLAENITFNIHCPFGDKYGNTRWLPVLTFEFNRYIYHKVNWTGFTSSDLLDVVQNVTWLRKQ